MKILIVGGGGREAALAWALRRPPHAHELLAAPGNPGIAEQARCLAVPADDLDGLVALARAERPDLILIGPELPLTLGLADRLEQLGVPAFGPSAAAARLEGSKAFAKEFMRRHRIPTARYRICTTAAEALAAVSEFGAPVVVKADGLAAGKGVTVAATRGEAEQAVRAAMSERVFGSAGDRVVIEECLTGQEASVLAFTDGERLAIMPAAQDHKRVQDHDQGPNTGGMGAYAPAPVLTPALLHQVRREIIEPTVRGLAAEGTPYRGVLYTGLMLTPAGPKVIEFNCRFGDPETQVILPLLESDLAETMLACVQGRLDPAQVRWRRGAAVCVVLAAGGYPGNYRKGDAITGLETVAARPGITVWHAGTRRQDGRLLTDGGRVLDVVAVADDLAAAVKQVYAAAADIHFAGAHYRRDIAARALNAIPGPGSHVT